MSVRDWLRSLEQFGIRLGLDTIGALVAALGHPERTAPALLVAGTNGKGSVVAMTAAACSAAGLRTGRYTSPHLVHLEERVAIDDVPVAPEVLDASLARVRDAAERLRASGRLQVHPTYFEATTAAAFDVFRERQVEVSVLEVGLGGRFDATNVCAPLVTAITSIALDHQAQLGDTLGAIAREKAGIVRRGVPVVTGPLPPEADAAVDAACAETGAPRIAAGAGVTADARIEDGLTVFACATPAGRYGPLRLGLRGRHQVVNALVAIRLLETARAEGLPVTAEAIARGLSTARWPARLDLVPRPGGPLLVDGAHNPAGAAALAAYVAEVWPGGLPVVFGAMRDKDLEGMLGALAPAATRLILTRAPGARAADPDRLAAAARHAAPSVAHECEDDPAAAVRRARAWGAPVVVAGSLYLAGAVLEAGGL